MNYEALAVEWEEIPEDQRTVQHGLDEDQRAALDYQDIAEADPIFGAMLEARATTRDPDMAERLTASIASYVMPPEAEEALTRKWNPELSDEEVAAVVALVDQRRKVARPRRAEVVRMAPRPVARPVARAPRARAHRSKGASSTRAPSGSDGPSSGDSDPPHPPLERLYSPAEVSKLWSIPADTLRAWARNGRLPSVRLGGVVRFRESDLAAFLKGGRS